MKHIAILSIALTIFIKANAQFFVSAGMNVTNNSTAIFTLQDINLINNGTFSQSGNKFYCTGTANSTISGTGSTSFGTLIMAKTGGANVLMNQNITVETQLAFSTCNLDVDKYILQLQPSATITNESDMSRMMSSSATPGYATITTNLNRPSGASPGGMGIIISSAQNLGNTTIKRGFTPQKISSLGSGIARYFDIAPTNNSGLNAYMRINYLAAELNANNENNLVIYKSDDNTNYASQGFSNRSASSNFVEITGIGNFSRFTLASSDYVLPITLVSFKAACENNLALLQWQSSSELNAAAYIIEKSTDASNWSYLSTVTAKNIPTGASYNYKDLSPLAIAFYRLKMIDKDGSFTYSSVFNGGCNILPAILFTVYPNPAHNEATAKFIVPQSGSGLISIFTSNGKLISQHNWNLQAGTNRYMLPEIVQLPAGTYVVRVNYDNGILENKLIKQL